MRPPTHDDPNAVPRNGTDVPWPDLQVRPPQPPVPREPVVEEQQDGPPPVSVDARY